MCHFVYRDKPDDMWRENEHYEVFDVTRKLIASQPPTPSPPSDGEYWRPFAYAAIAATAVDRAPLVLLGGEWRVISWEKTTDVADLCKRLEMDSITAVRASVLGVSGVPATRMYLFVAETSSFRWTITLGFRSGGDDWDRLAADDATAAVTFSNMQLG